MEDISLHVPLNKLEYRSTVEHRSELSTPGQPDLLYIITTQGYPGERKQPWPPERQWGDRQGPKTGKGT